VTRQEIILRTARYGLFRQGFVIGVTEDQNRDVGRHAEQLLERLHSVTVGQRQIEQNSGNSFFAEASETLGKLPNPLHVERTGVCVRESTLNRIGNSGIVFN